MIGTKRNVLDAPSLVRILQSIRLQRSFPGSADGQGRKNSAVRDQRDHDQIRRTGTGDQRSQMISQQVIAVLANAMSREQLHFNLVPQVPITRSPASSASSTQAFLSLYTRVWITISWNLGEQEAGRGFLHFLASAACSPVQSTYLQELAQRLSQSVFECR